jgi:hypothetical protein
VERLVDDLAANGWGFRPYEGPTVLSGTGDGSLLLDQHESLGASRVPEVLTHGLIALADRDASPWQQARIAIGNTGVAAIAVPIRIPLGTGDFVVAFGAIEQVLHGPVAGLLALVERCLVSQVGPSPDRGHAELPAGRLLWWHRIAMLPVVDHIPAEHRSFGREIKLDGDIHMLVGQGYSYLVGRDISADVVSQALRGILLATEDWLGLDSINRRISSYLDRLPQVSDDRSGVRELETLARESLEFTIEIDALQLYLEERNRYLAIGRRAVWMAARSEWGIEDEMGKLRERSNAARELAESLRNEKVGIVDRARNTLLFILAFGAVIQVLLLAFDFAMNTNRGPVLEPRIIFGLTAFSVTAILAVFALRRWH